MKFKIDPRIFSHWPEVKIGVVVALGIDNRKGSQADKEILSLLREQEKKIPELLGGLSVGQLPKVAAWRQVYQDFGITGNRYRSSVEALLRRVKAGNPLPDINPLVNLYNSLSLKHQLPFGGENLSLIQGDIILKVCEGEEKGIYIGGNEEVACEPGEVAYCDDEGFICRRWNWREAERTKLTEDTRAAVLVAEAMPPATEKELQIALNELKLFLEEKMAGQVKLAILGRNNPELEIDYQPLPQTGGQAKKLKKTAKKGEKGAVGKIPPLLQKEYLTGLKGQITGEVRRAVKEIGFDETLAKIDHPANPEYGDYFTNVALILYPQIKKTGKNQSKNNDLKADLQAVKSPLDLAHKLQTTIKNFNSSLIEKVEAAPPGFLNIWLKNDAIISQLRQVLKTKEAYGTNEYLEDKRILLEHTSPNPITTIHIGHLRNNLLGMAVMRVFKALGAKVTLDCINNDRGTHVCRAIFGYLVFARKKIALSKETFIDFQVTDQQIKAIAQEADWRQLLDEWLMGPNEWLKPADLGLKSDHLNLIFYSLGSRAEKLVDKVKDQVREILRDWEDDKAKVRALWRQIIDWSLQGYEVTYKRIGSYHDLVWHESDLYQGGKQLVEKGLRQNVFVYGKSEGATVPDQTQTRQNASAAGPVATNLSSYNLPDTLVRKSDGTALYLTFDLNLTLKKRLTFPADLYIWDIGNDQLLYLKQLFAVCEQLGIGKREDYYHFNFGYVYLKSGEKMSSRKATVITADELLDYMKKKAHEIMFEAKKQSGPVEAQDQSLNGLTPQKIEETAEKIGLGALKYSLLKTSRANDIHFDPDSSVSLSGDSGPYLQYTNARCQSVLKKAVEKKVVFSLSEYDLFRGRFASLGQSADFPRSGGLFPASAAGSKPSLANFPSYGGSKMGAQTPFGTGLPAYPPSKSALVEKGPVASASPSVSLNDEEMAILRTVYRYPEVILEAGQNLEISGICHYLYDLAKKFNLFYSRHSILGLLQTMTTEPASSESDDFDDLDDLDEFGYAADGDEATAPAPPGRDTREDKKTTDQGKINKDIVCFRLALTAAVAQILQNGLIILGIEPLDRM